MRTNSKTVRVTTAALLAGSIALTASACSTSTPAQTAANKALASATPNVVTNNVDPSVLIGRIQLENTFGLKLGLPKVGTFGVQKADSDGNYRLPQRDADYTGTDNSDEGISVQTYTEKPGSHALYDGVLVQFQKGGSTLGGIANEKLVGVNDAEFTFGNLTIGGKTKQLLLGLVFQDARTGTTIAFVVTPDHNANPAVSQTQLLAAARIAQANLAKLPAPAASNK